MINFWFFDISIRTIFYWNQLTKLQKNGLSILILLSGRVCFSLAVSAVGSWEPAHSWSNWDSVNESSANAKQLVGFLIWAEKTQRSQRKAIGFDNARWRFLHFTIFQITINFFTEQKVRIFGTFCNTKSLLSKEASIVNIKILKFKHKKWYLCEDLLTVSNDKLNAKSEYFS